MPPEVATSAPEPALTDEQRLIQETARRFAGEVIRPWADAGNASRTYDPSLAPRLGEIGYLGSILPEPYGGRGLDYTSYGLIVEEVGRADSSARTIVSVGTSLVGATIARWGTEAQKERWLPGLCAGEALGCFGLTEPDSGSDAASIRARATKTADGWSISGQKMWISFGSVAAFGLIFAVTDPDAGAKGITAFIVPTDAPGYSAQPIAGKLGLWACDTASIALDDVKVGEDSVLGEVGQGFKVAMSALDSGRYSVAAGCAGICAGCVEESVAYSLERRQFGKPIGSFQLVQAMIAEMVVRRDASRALVRRAGLLKDEGAQSTTETSVAKLYATEASIECANLAIQVHGGAGYVDDHIAERYLRDARVTTLYEGTSQIQKLIIGRAATKINAIA